MKPETPRAMTDINLTPMIDVLLVLLILFMVAVPAAQRGLDVAMAAKSGRAASPPDALPPPVLQIRAGEFELAGERHPTLDALELALHATFASRRERALIVKSDGDVEYGRVVAAMDAARGAGVTRFGVASLEAEAGP